MKSRVAIVIYSNHDYYPPVINTMNILAAEYDVIVVSRNQDQVLNIEYPLSAKIYRVGKAASVREKESRGVLNKIFEYIVFVLHAIYYVRYCRCSLIYSYDMHGYIAALIASRCGHKVPLIYHNLELVTIRGASGMGAIIKRLELLTVRYADKVIFADRDRAFYFQTKTRLETAPDIVINAPLSVAELPKNRLGEIMKERGFSACTKIVLYQGTISEGRALSETVISMVSWPQDTVLVLIGYIIAGFMNTLRHVIATHGLSGRILYFPFVPYPDMLSYTVGAHLGLALYDSKDINRILVAGASNKIYEYLSMGVPIVTNDDQCFRDQLDESYAYFVKPGSADTIAHAINTALSCDEEYRRKRIAARQCHLARCNYEMQFLPILKYIEERCSVKEDIAHKHDGRRK